MKLRIWNYGNYLSDNYGPCRAVQLGDLILYFSYDTVIAFESPKTFLVVSKNYWSKTTGKHLNWISPNKKIRVASEEFERALKETLREHGLEIE
jgi:hypothetical protein